MKNYQVKFLGSKSNIAYTYRAFQKYAPGDIVVVESQSSYSLAEIIAEEEEKQYSFELKWIVCKCDFGGGYAEIKKQEKMEKLFFDIP